MSFSARALYDRLMHNTISEMFSRFGEGEIHVARIGQEVTIGDKSEHIRYKRDKTTKFVRYMPDLLVFRDKQVEGESWLVELKVAMTGLRSEDSGLMKGMRAKVPDLRTNEVFNIELESWKNLLSLRGIGLNVVILAYCHYHPVSRWLALVPDARLELSEHSTMLQTAGSGTPIANILARVDNITVFSLPWWVVDKKLVKCDQESVREFLENKESLF